MFGIRKYAFSYVVQPEKAADTLARIVDATENIVGKVDTDAVKLHRRLPMWFRNSFNPIFVGSFSSVGQGAVLTGRFRVHWFTSIFMIVFIGVSASSVFDTWSAPSQRPGYVEGWRENRLRFDLQFLGLAFLLPVIGWVVGLPSKKAILKVLEESSNKPLQPIAHEDARSG